MIDTSCFKAYDVRGKIGSQLTNESMMKIGYALASVLSAKSLVIGFDVRETSEEFALHFSQGARAAGAEVINIGMAATEEIYFATSHLSVDAGVEVTASHNPIDYNGLKFVGSGSTPISQEVLYKIRDLANSIDVAVINKKLRECRATIEAKDIRNEYVAKVLNFLSLTTLPRYKIVVNAGNGCAGPIIKVMQAALGDRGFQIEFIELYTDTDHTFPNGIPNPLLPENQRTTSDAVLKHGADFGVAWDGDSDRCFLFDETGRFIDGYYIVGLLAEMMCEMYPKAKIVHDPRQVWNTIEIVEELGGKAIESKTGHAFIKETMRKHDAVYGGEMSAHHYFKDFYYCDTGMVPWLLVMQLMAQKNKKLSELVNEMMSKYPVSGEINFVVDDSDSLIKQLTERYRDSAIEISHTDGLSVTFKDWRFNIRSSNTEPLVRLNLETRSDKNLVRERTQELTQEIENFG